MKSFSSSLVLHLGLLLVLYFLKGGEVEKSQPVSTTEFIEFLTETKKKTQQLGRENLGGHRPRGDLLGKLKMENLLPQTVETPDFENQGHLFNSGGEDLYQPDNPADSWGAGGREYGRIKDYVKVEKVAHMVEGLVEFPHPLAYRKMGGVVKARLVLTEAGDCDWNFTNIAGNLPELRFYILMVFKKFCSGDVWHRLKKRKSSNIDFAFNFDVYGSKTSKPRVLGNVILFNLPGYQKRGEWKLGPIKGNILAPPMIYLNPTWVVENWNSLIHSKDPLREFKERSLD